MLNLVELKPSYCFGLSSIGLCWTWRHLHRWVMIGWIWMTVPRLWLCLGGYSDAALTSGRGPLPSIIKVGSRMPFVGQWGEMSLPTATLRWRTATFFYVVVCGTDMWASNCCRIYATPEIDWQLYGSWWPRSQVIFHVFLTLNSDGTRL